MRNILLVIILSFLVVGCATSYQPKSYTGGFEDINHGQGKHEITFFGNGYTPKNQMQYYTKKRSGELCVDGFIQQNFFKLNLYFESECDQIVIKM
jgi:hypothetical protein